MHVEQWQALGIICGALLALWALLTQIHRRVLRPVWQSFRNAAQLLEQLTGDKAKGIPSLMDRLAQVAENQRVQGTQLAAHLEWHGQEAEQPPATQPVKSNGQAGR